MKFKRRKLLARPSMTLYGHEVHCYTYDDISICVSEDKIKDAVNPSLVVSFSAGYYNPDTKLMDSLLQYFGMNMNAPIQCFSGPIPKESKQKPALYFLQEMAIA